MLFRGRHWVLSADQFHGRPSDGSAKLDQSFRAPLIAYFSRRLQHAHDPRREAEDLTQEVFLRLSKHPDRNNGETIQSYVFTIAANVLRDRLKSSGLALQTRSNSIEGNQESFAIRPELTEVLDPERVLVAKETLKDVLAALDELGERTRDIFILARLENMHHREIAVLHGISISAVEKHIMKASAHIGPRFPTR